METMENLPQTELVKLEISGSTCHITLDREEKYNALNVQMITELCTIFDWTAKRSAGNVDFGDGGLRSASVSTVSATNGRLGSSGTTSKTTSGSSDAGGTGGGNFQNAKLLQEQIKTQLKPLMERLERVEDVTCTGINNFRTL